MSEKNTITAPETRQISQVPVWAHDAKFEITGSQFMAMQNFFNMFAEPMSIVQQLFRDGLNTGTIQTRYQDPEGNEVPKEEVDEYIKKMQEYQEQMLAQIDSKASTPTSPKKLKSKTTVTEEA